jgi:hypothetical protein
MNNKEQIAELEKSIDYCRRSIESQTETMNIESEQLKQLKKEAAVKAVFPSGPENNGGICYAYFKGAKRASQLGLSEYGDKKNIEKWLEARAHVIEAINQANGGRGKFEANDDNFYFTFDARDNSFHYSNETTMKTLHDDFYLHHSKEQEAGNLIGDLTFMQNYKIMSEIK